MSIGHFGRTNTRRIEIIRPLGYFKTDSNEAQSRDKQMDLKDKVKIPTWLKRTAPAIALAIVFGVAGYFITPQSAKSKTLQIKQNLHRTQSKLKKVLSIQAKLKKQLNQTQEELSSAREKIQTLAQQLEAEKNKLTAAQNTIATLTEKLDKTNKAIEPLTNRLQQTTSTLTEYQSKLEQANNRITSLTKQINTLLTDKKELEKIKDSLTEEKGKLLDTLDMKNQYIAHLLRYLATLDLGGELPRPDEITVSKPLGMPITSDELIKQAGYPTMVFQTGNAVEMEWTNGDKAKAIDGIIVEINSKPATRETLAAMGISLPKYYQPANWRYKTGEKIYYADLVELFGKPERIAGTAKEFVAWWPIGAWGRSVPVKVSQGVVVSFAGQKPDGALLCQLVRQRNCAYGTVTKDVINTAAAAHDAYCRAALVVKKYLTEQAYLRGRDGLRLDRWKMAPLDSVGTWIAFEIANTPAAIIRTCVDCTWVTPDGQEKTERRYAVITIPMGENQQNDTVKCTLFAPVE